VTFTARYPGTCADCEDDIRPGEEIHTDGYGGFMHVHCRQPDRPVAICPTCYLTRPCEHDEDDS
jgi:hypothetical protein